jgi:D-arginine dehydrogenase
MQVDAAIIGGGIAGVSCAAYLAPHMSVAVMEMESTLGYHATGRSAAVYTECYGAEPIRRLTLASKSYFLDRPEPFGTLRGVLFLAPVGGRHLIDEFYRTFSSLVPDLAVLSSAEVSDLVGVVDEDATSGGILEPGAFDLHVHSILTSYASTVRNHGGIILTRTPAHSVDRVNGRWQIAALEEEVSAHIVVNAAGAWGDRVASLFGIQPLGLTPFKRSAFTFDPGIPTAHWPMIVDISETWYLKPEGPHLLGSAASEIPQDPADARHDEIDVALGIQRIAEATTLRIRSVKNQWAGLRTFTPDRVPAVGRDTDDDNFFWLVGQGGYGIHTSPAMGALAAGLIRDDQVPEEVLEFGITAEMFDPSRFR